MTSVAERFDLEGWLEERRPQVEAALARTMEASAGLLPAELGAAARHGVLGGGKRVRPLLLVAAWHAAGRGDEPDALHDLAAAPELIHAYSLMHDDLPCMDDAALRRGRPATHRVHGDARTMVAGAALIPLAGLTAWTACQSLGVGRPRAGEVVATLMEAAGAAGMVGGQVLDLLGEGRALTAGELDAIHRRKTGALLTAPLVMGGLAAGAPDRVLEGLRSYGHALGLAFQVADDILDATASAGELGKNPSDAQLDKATYASVHGLPEARRRAADLSARAVEALDGAGLEAPPLHALARYVVARRR